ncbi:MAG: hypothetical protein WKF84_16325 [Pyrinomonadaceae bacterium]
MNAIGGDTLRMIKIALAEVEKNFVGSCGRQSGVELLRLAPT